MDANPRRATVRPRVIGLSFALLVHVALLMALVWGVRVNIPPAPTPIEDVQLLKSWPKPFLSALNRSAEAQRVEQPTASEQDKSPLTAPAMSMPSASPPPVAAALRPSGALGSQQNWPSGDARLSSALRNSLVGCADADASKLSESEREGCRQRLAGGASTARYISGVSVAKREYYQALQGSEDAMMRDPMGGIALESSVDAVPKTAGSSWAPFHARSHRPHRHGCPRSTFDLAERRYSTSWSAKSFRDEAVPVKFQGQLSEIAVERTFSEVRKGVVIGSGHGDDLSDGVLAAMATV